MPKADNKKVGKTFNPSMVVANTRDFTSMVDNVTFGVLGGMPVNLNAAPNLTVEESKQAVEHWGRWAAINGLYFTQLAKRFDEYKTAMERTGKATVS